MKPARVVALLLVGGALAAAGAAVAAPDDRASAEAVLREVETSPRKAVAAELVARSKAALERAGRLRASGDEGHARLADGVAHTWAEAAREVLRAAELEDKATALRQSATDAGVIAERERALLEEAITQSGRLRAQLDGMKHDGKDRPARTNVAGANADAGVKSVRPDGGAR